jgi:hypothetical protein
MGRFQDFVISGYAAMRDFEVNSASESRALTTGDPSKRSKQAAAPPSSASTQFSTSTIAMRGLSSLDSTTASRYVRQLQRRYGNRFVQLMLASVKNGDEKATPKKPIFAADEERARSQSNAPLVERDTGGSGARGNEGAEPFVSLLGDRWAHSSVASRTIQREAADVVGGATAPAAPTEHLGGTLWAVDASGKTLPPSLDDISQGGVNDCFLFAAMAAIVNANPQQIVNMIRDNGNGTYTVTFKGIGFFTSAEETVSADFTVGQHGNVTARRALWPLVIEKAYAQQKGGLEALGKGGNAGNALDEMLNEGPSRFDPREKSADYILGKVAKAKERNWPMTILSPKQEGTSKDKQTLADNTPGLHFWHTYAIIDVDAANNRIKLFNPWGHDHPNGDGWMDIEQVRKFFIEIDIND